ncbi:hypothetical protein [Pontixanthobacter sp.]|uniref:hypothetical protein n=1 Tax=Pontixanthobacter sp. TaxID=2792078 RepID=UPI003C79B941
MGDRLDRQLRIDRALRSSAKAVVLADIDHVKQDIGAKTIGARFAGRLSAGLDDISEQASGLPGGKLAIVAAIASGAAIWLARKPIAELFGNLADPSAITTDKAAHPDNKIEPK